MAPIDIAIIGIIGISCLLGLFRGLIKEALSLAAWIGAVVAAGMFNGWAGELLSGVVANPAMQKTIGAIVIFIVVVFGGGLIANVASKLFTAAGLGAADRALGGVFGIVRGLVIVVVIVTFTASLTFTQRYYSESQAMPYLMMMVERLRGWFEFVPPGTALPLTNI